jgi:hypothetical protein
MVILFVSGILFHFDCWFFLVASGSIKSQFLLPGQNSCGNTIFLGAPQTAVYTREVSNVLFWYLGPSTPKKKTCVRATARSRKLSTGNY